MPPSAGTAAAGTETGKGTRSRANDSARMAMETALWHVAARRMTRPEAPGGSRLSPRHNDRMTQFSAEVLQAAAREREVHLTTIGRKTGKPRRVTIWIGTDGKRLSIRSGQGMRRHWPQNMLANGEGVVRLAKSEVKDKPRLVTGAAEARARSGLDRSKYRPFVPPSKAVQPAPLL